MNVILCDERSDTEKEKSQQFHIWAHAMGGTDTVGFA